MTTTCFGKTNAELGLPSVTFDVTDTLQLSDMGDVAQCIY